MVFKSDGHCFRWSLQGPLRECVAGMEWNVFRYKIAFILSKSLRLHFRSTKVWKGFVWGNSKEIKKYSVVVFFVCLFVSPGRWRLPFCCGMWQGQNTLRLGVCQGHVAVLTGEWLGRNLSDLIWTVNRWSMNLLAGHSLSGRTVFRVSLIRVLGESSALVRLECK